VELSRAIAPQVPPALQVNQESQAREVNPDFPDRLEFPGLELRPLERRLASLALLDLKDPLDLMDPQVPPDLLETPASPDFQETLEFPEFKGLRETQVPPESQVSPDNQGNPVNLVNRQLLAHLDRKDLRVPPDLLAIPDNLDKSHHQAHPDQQDQLDQSDSPVSPEAMEYPVIPAHPASPAQMPLTARALREQVKSARSQRASPHIVSGLFRPSTNVEMDSDKDIFYHILRALKQKLVAFFPALLFIVFQMSHKCEGYHKFE